VKTHKTEPAPLLMITAVQEFFEQLHWKFARVLDREGISMLQWAFMQRAFDERNGIPFSLIIEVTGETKDNVRRAAAKLQGFADVITNPRDRRAKNVVLTRRGRSRTRLIMGRLEKEMFKLLGARDERSDRVSDFKQLLWDASAYLVPSDLADEEMTERWVQHRLIFPDTSLNYVEETSAESVWVQEETPDDSIPW
jgi:DNA-binding MarR family transcriptional regulator